jgi:hypothetical protein
MIKTVFTKATHNMTHFWAKYFELNNNLFRLDTRIYLIPTEFPLIEDVCIGGIIGKNTGSAMPGNFLTNRSFVPIKLNGDKLLPTVRNILNKANGKFQKGEYVQILNTFYLCNPDLDEAITRYGDLRVNISCESEKRTFPWIWVVWGGDDNRLKKFKERFYSIENQKFFFFNNSEKAMNLGLPRTGQLARHTQGLKHDYVVPFFQDLFGNLT